jgi:hypothetical protein
MTLQAGEVSNASEAPALTSKLSVVSWEHTSLCIVPGAEVLTLSYLTMCKVLCNNLHTVQSHPTILHAAVSPTEDSVQFSCTPTTIYNV